MLQLPTVSFETMCYSLTVFLAFSWLLNLNMQQCSLTEHIPATVL